MAAIAVAVGLALTGAAPAHAVGSPVLIDSFDGQHLGTRTITDYNGYGASYTGGDNGSFTANIPGANDANLRGLTLKYSNFGTVDLTSGGNNTQIFFVFSSINRTNSNPGDTALSITAQVTDANGVTGTYNTGVSNTGAFNIVLNFHCESGQTACFSPQPDFTKVTSVAIQFWAPRNYDSGHNTTATLSRIATTPTGGAAPPRPAATITPSVSAPHTPATSMTFNVAFTVYGQQTAVSQAASSAFSLDPSGPAGATISSVTGGPGSYTVTVTGLGNDGDIRLLVAGGAVTDGWGQTSISGDSGWIHYTKYIAPSFSNSSSVFAFQANHAKSYALQPAGVPATTVSLGSGTLPSGVTLGSDGTLSGTPVAGSGGSYPITVTASNGYGTPASKSLTVIVDENANVLTAPTVASNAGQAIASSSATHIIPVSGYPAATLSIDSSQLPAGVTVSAAGEVSGTPAAGTAGSYSIAYTVAQTDAATSFSNSVTGHLSLHIYDPATAPASTHVSAVVGEALPATSISLTGSPAPSVTVDGPATLPDGVSVASDGTISGTPTAPGHYEVGYTATNAGSGGESGFGGSATGQIVFDVDQHAAIADPALVQRGVAGTALDVDLGVTGSPAAAVAITSGALPDGITVSGDHLVGTPIAGGDVTVGYTATVNDDATGFSDTQSGTVRFVIDEAPTVAASTTVTGVAGTALSLQLTATGFPAPSFAVTSGTLPDGLTLSSDGVLSGTPTSDSTATVEFTATSADADSAFSEAATGELVFAIDAAPANPSGTGDPGLTSPPPTPSTPALAITTGATLPGGKVGVSYSFTLKRSGGATGGSWAYVIGKLPAGTKSYANGNIRGIPTAKGTFHFTMRYTDGSRATVQKNFTIVVKAGTLKAPVPKIAGKAKVGVKLTAKPGTWTSKTKLSYHWYANARPIPGATHSTYRVTASQAGKRITVKVTGSKSGYTTVTKTSKATAKAAR